MKTLSVGCTLLLALHATLSGPIDQPQFTARATAVAIDVSVTDAGVPIGGLTGADFVVIDNGVPQAVMDVSQDRVPIDVSITADVSGSMRPADRLVINQAIEQVGRALRPEDRATVAFFWSHISERFPLGPPPIALTAGETGQNTSILDAMLLALIRPGLPDRRQFSILMTDGIDSNSYFDATVVEDVARHTNGPMTIVLAPDRAGTTMEETFATVAKLTGGVVIALRDRERLTETFGRALDNFRSSYVVRYIPTGVSSPGWHDVTVTVKNRSYTVRARQGYMLPS